MNITIKQNLDINTFSVKLKLAYFPTEIFV